MVVDKRIGWLATLKVGDRVAIAYKTITGDINYSLNCNVNKITPSGMISVKKVNGEVERFSANGFLGHTKIVMQTDDLVSEVRAERLYLRNLKKVKEFPFERLSSSNLAEVVSLLERLKE